MNSLPKTFTRQRRGYDLNPGPSAPESSTLTTRLPSRRVRPTCSKKSLFILSKILRSERSGCREFGTPQHDASNRMPHHDALYSSPVFFRQALVAS